MVGYFYRETKWIKINNHSIPAPQFLIKERWDQLWDMYNEVKNFVLGCLALDFLFSELG